VDDGKLGELNHQWLQPKARQLQIESGESLYQRRCVRCGRDFITLSATGICYAASLSAVSFFRLADEVTQRWLAEDCPGKRLPSDDVDRGKWVDELRVKSGTAQNAAQGRRPS
jgi:hypothetical protein